MSVLVATSDGLHVLSPSGDVMLAGHSVDALASSETSTFAIVDGHEVRARDADDGTWQVRAAWDVELSSVHVLAGSVFVGTYDARLLHLRDGMLEPLTAFDDAPGRAEWHAVGPALNVRSMTSTSDGRALLANVHVGGILRSADGGASWVPTLPVDNDVHEVCAHPSDPSIVVAAAAVGLCRSTDGGATWSVDTDGLPHTYARAAAFTGDDVLVSVSDGPFARRSAIYRAPVVGGPLERVAHGLPQEGLEGNVDTACLATAGADAALGDGGGDVWARRGGTWERIAVSIGEVHCVALV